MEDSGNAPIPAQGDASRDSRGSLAASAVTEVASVPPLVSSSRTFFDIIGEAVGVADELPPVDSNPTPPAPAPAGPDDQVPEYDPEDLYLLPDAEDLEIPNRPDFIDVFMPPVDMSRVGHLAFAYPYPPLQTQQKLLEVSFANMLVILGSL